MDDAVDAAKLTWMKQFLRSFEAAFNAKGRRFAKFETDGKGKATMTISYEEGPGHNLVFDFTLMRMDDIIRDDCKLELDQNSNIRQGDLSLGDCSNEKAFMDKIRTDGPLKTIFVSMKKVGILMGEWLVFCVKNKDGLNAIVGGRRRLAVAMFLHKIIREDKVENVNWQQFFFLDAKNVLWVPVFFMAEEKESLAPLQISKKLQTLFEAKVIFAKYLERGPAYLAMGMEVAPKLKVEEIVFKNSDSIGDFVARIFTLICSSLKISEMDAQDEHFHNFTHNGHWEDKEKNGLIIRTAFCNYCFCLMSLGEGRQSLEGDLKNLLDNKSSFLELLKKFRKAKQHEAAEVMCRSFLVLALFGGEQKTEKIGRSKQTVMAITLGDIAKLYWNYFCVVYGSVKGSEDYAFLERLDSCLKENESLRSQVFTSNKPTKTLQIFRFKLVESLFRVQLKQFEEGKYFGVFDELGKLLPNLMFCQLCREHFCVDDPEVQKHLDIVFPPPEALEASLSKHKKQQQKKKQKKTETFVLDSLRRLFLNVLVLEKFNFGLSFPLSKEQISSLDFIMKKCRLSKANFHPEPLKVLRQSYIEKKLLLANDALPMSPVAMAEVGKVAVADPLSGYLLAGQYFMKSILKDDDDDDEPCRISFVTIRTVEQVVESCKEDNVKENDIRNVVQQIATNVAALMNKKEPSVIAGCVAAALAKASNQKPIEIIMAAGMGAAKAVLEKGLEVAVSAACSVVEMFALDFKLDFPVHAGKVAARVAKDLFKQDANVISATAAVAAYAAAPSTKKKSTDISVGLAAAFETVLEVEFIDALVAYASAAQALNLEKETMVLEVGKAAYEIAEKKSVDLEGRKTALALAATKAWSYFGFDRNESWMLAGMLAKRMIEQSDPPVDKATVYAGAGSAAAKAASVLFPQVKSIELASYAAAAAATAAAGDSDSAEDLTSAEETALVSAVYSIIEACFGEFTCDDDGTIKEAIAIFAPLADASFVPEGEFADALKPNDAVAPVANHSNFCSAVAVGAAVAKAAEKLEWKKLEDVRKVVEIASNAAVLFAINAGANYQFSQLACIGGAVASLFRQDLYALFVCLGIAVAVASGHTKKQGIDELLGRDFILEKTGMLAVSLFEGLSSEEKFSEEDATETVRSIGLAVAGSLTILSTLDSIDFDDVGAIVAKVVSEKDNLGCPVKAAMNAIIFVAKVWRWNSLEISRAIGKVVVRAARTVVSRLSVDGYYALAGSGAFSLSEGVIDENTNFIVDIGSAVFAVKDAIEDKSELKEFLEKVFCKSISDAMISAEINWNVAWENAVLSPTEKAKNDRFTMAVDHVASFIVSFVHSRSLEGIEPIDVAASSVMNVLKLCSADMPLFEKVVHVGFGVGFAAKTMRSLKKLKERKKWDPKEIVSLAVRKALEFAGPEGISEVEPKKLIAEKVAFYVGHLVLRMDQVKKPAFDISDICLHVGVQVAEVAFQYEPHVANACVIGVERAKACVLFQFGGELGAQISDLEANFKKDIEAYFVKRNSPSLDEEVEDEVEEGGGFEGSFPLAGFAADSAASAAPPVEKKKRERSKSKNSIANDPVGGGRSKSVEVAKNEKVAQPAEKEKALKSECLFRTKNLLLSPSVLHFNVDNDLFTCLHLLRDNAAFVKACDARICPLLIVDAMDVPNDAIDLLLNALISTRFAIAFPMIVDTRSRPDLISKVLYLGSRQEEFYGTVGFITIVSHRIFANAICVSTLGGLGSIVKEFRLSEFCGKSRKDFSIRNRLLFFQIGAAALEPKNCFLLSKVLNVENVEKYSFKLSSKRDLIFPSRFEIGNVNYDEFYDNLIESSRKEHFQSVLNLENEAGGKAEEDDDDDDDDNEDNFYDSEDEEEDSDNEEEDGDEGEEFEEDDDDDDDDGGSGPSVKKKSKQDDVISFIYPPNDEARDRVTVKKSDLMLVDDRQCLNDNIISFYIKFMEASLLKLSPTYVRIPKSYIFSCFFYTMLVAKNKKELKDLFRWLKDEWFKNDYFVVPINETVHWYLAIVDLKGKKIFFLDSKQRKDYSVAAERILSFLNYSFQEKKMNMEVRNFKVEAVEVPQQQNAFDCGVFLLHFLERFLFSSFLREGNNGYSKLFPIAEIAEKRKDLKRILLAFGENLPHNVSAIEEEALKKFRGMLTKAELGEENENEQQKKSDPEDLSTKKRERSEVEEEEKERVDSNKKQQLADPLKGLN